MDAANPSSPCRRHRQARQTGRIHYTRTRSSRFPRKCYERHRVASVSSDSKADAFRLLRTQLLLQMREKGWQTLAVTSPNKGAGKSTVALNLAINFALEVDYTGAAGGCRSARSVHSGHARTRARGLGLADYLLGKASLPNLLHPSEHRGPRRASRRRAGPAQLGTHALADDGEDGSRDAQPLSRSPDRIRRAAGSRRRGHARTLRRTWT